MINKIAMLGLRTLAKDIAKAIVKKPGPQKALVSGGMWKGKDAENLILSNNKRMTTRAGKVYRILSDYGKEHSAVVKTVGYGSAGLTAVVADRAISNKTKKKEEQ